VQTPAWLPRIVPAVHSRMKGKAEQMKEARERITVAALFTLLAEGPATLIAGVVLLVSQNGALGSGIFFSIFAAGLLEVFWWSGRRAAAGQKGDDSSTQGARMSVHQFIAHMKMHPELMPAGMTEFGLECFCKLCRKPGQETELDNWIKQLTSGGPYSQHA
jgi:hypothetical protein